MARKRPYDLLCPIARALDVLGDRWTLLILRDLHAGPARFAELERLGMAPNLLTQRLSELTEAGLIERSAPGDRAPYELTELGRGTDLLLWELSRFGGMLEPHPEPRQPGNLRTIALPLRILLQRAPRRPRLVVRLHVDDDTFTIVSARGGVQVLYGSEAAQSHRAQLELATDYESFLATGEGRMEPAEFVANHLEVVEGADRLADFLGWMSAALAQG